MRSKQNCFSNMIKAIFVRHIWHKIALLSTPYHQCPVSDLHSHWSCWKLKAEVCILQSQMAYHVSLEETGGSSHRVPTWDARAWHTVQLVPPASEPFKSALLCLKQSICSHFPGIVTPIEFKFTSSVAAASFPSVWCLKETGGVNIFFFLFFLVMILIKKNSLGQGES